MKLVRYLRLLRVFLTSSISAQMEYRANFLMGLLGALFSSGSALFGLLVLTGERGTVGGWSYDEASIVVGFFMIVQGIIGGLLYPNLNKIAEQIRLGTMDFTLLKPIDAQFLVSSRNISLFPMSNILIGLIVIGNALPRVAGATLSGLLLGLLLFATSLMILYAIWFMLSTTAFWFVKVENITELFNSLFRAGQFPVSAFPGWVRVFFTFIVPIAFITTIPSEAVIGRMTLSNTLLAFLIAALLMGIARWFWRLALRNYTSASS